MLTIIDKIKLKDPAYEDDFVKWVREADYLTCHELPSVQSFCVHKVMRGADSDFGETITVSSWKAYFLIWRSKKGRNSSGTSPLTRYLEKVSDPFNNPIMTPPVKAGTVA